MTTPIWLVVGFLGAGKTTVLRRLVRHADGRNLVFVVNEFSAVDVDAGLIEREGGTALAVAGGSIFCRCLVTEFVNTLRRAADGVQNPRGDIIQPRGIVVEASGMADPRAMRRLLAEGRLEGLYHVAGVIAVVDPGVLMRLLLVLPSIRGQIASADLILLNKTDIRHPDTVAKVREKIAAVNPDAAVVRCAYGDVPPEVILAENPSARVARMDAAFGLCKDPNFDREVVRLPSPVSAEQIRAVFAAGCGEGLYRAKGTVSTTAGWHYLDWNNGDFSLTPCPPADASSVVLIWDPARPCAVSRQLQALRAN